MIYTVQVALSTPVAHFPSKYSQKGVTGKAEIVYVKDKKESPNWDTQPRGGDAKEKRGMEFRLVPRVCWAHWILFSIKIELKRNLKILLIKET